MAYDGCYVINDIGQAVCHKWQVVCHKCQVVCHFNFLDFLDSVFQVIIRVDILIYRSGCGRVSIDLWHK